MKVVVDASVAVKWFVTEQWTEESRRLLARSIDRYAPDLILSETANVIWKKARRKEIQDPNRYFAELAHLPDVLVLRPSQEIVARASTIAWDLNHPVYDCLYLACAEAEGMPLVTADRRLQAAVEGRLAVDVWHIGDEEVNRRVVAVATDLDIAEDSFEQR